MNSMIKKAAITGAAAAAALGISMGPAAAVDVVVSGGPSFTASSTDSQLASGIITVECDQAYAAGEALPGSYTLPATVANITSFEVDDCTFFGVDGAVSTSASASNPWPLTATSKTSTGATGTVSNVHVTMSIPSLGCTITIEGSTPATWNNNQTLSFAGGSGLTTDGDGFCLGLGSTGDFTGSFAVDASPDINVA